MAWGLPSIKTAILTMLYVGTLGGFLGVHYAYRDIVETRRFWRDVEQCKKNQEERERQYQEWVREHERKMFEKYGDNWRDHEPKGIRRLVVYA